MMTDWFARPVLHVTDVDASLRFYVDRLGFTNPWRHEEDGKALVAQVDRQGCALIMSCQWPEKVGKGLTFITAVLGLDPVDLVQPDHMIDLLIRGYREGE